jgi:hypothetical protein
MLRFGDASSGGAIHLYPSTSFFHPKPPRRQRQAIPADGGVCVARIQSLTPLFASPPAHAALPRANPPSKGSHSAPSHAPCHSTRHGNPAQRQCCWYQATHQRNPPGAPRAPSRLHWSSPLAACSAGPSWPRTSASCHRLAALGSHKAPPAHPRADRKGAAPPTQSARQSQ